MRTITQKKTRNGVDEARDVTDCTQLLLRPPRGALNDGGSRPAVRGGVMNALNVAIRLTSASSKERT